jgi:hypothetical protein
MVIRLNTVIIDLKINRVSTVQCSTAHVQLKEDKCGRADLSLILLLHSLRFSH